MRLVAHISDLHFGEHDPTIAAALLVELNTLRPTLVVISGDLTQRARVSQFQAASTWLERLEVPHLVVPGNHDVPLYDLPRRFVAPLDRFRRYIEDNLEPCFISDELAVCGVNTTKSLTVKSGQISGKQAKRTADRLRNEQGWKVVVAHHPIAAPPGTKQVAEGAVDALTIFERAGIDLVLTGHLHVPHVGGRNEAHTIIGVQAGSCISTRLRGEPNGYNHLWLDGERVTIIHREWDGGRFADGEAKSYERGDRGERLRKVGTG